MSARLLVSCSVEEEEAFLELARRCKVSPSILGGLAVRQMLMADRSGARPMIRPALKSTPHKYHDTENWNFGEEWTQYPS